MIECCRVNIKTKSLLKYTVITFLKDQTEILPR